ncbi:MAG: hypothetical protein Q9167_004470 [Letrouitia subvulpina]
MANTIHFALMIAEKNTVQNIRSLRLDTNLENGLDEAKGKCLEEHVTEVYRIRSMAPLEELHLGIESKLFSGFLVNRVDPFVLKTLEIPFPGPPTHLELGNLLSRLENLNSLTIINIPTRKRFFEGLPLIGEGLMASLRTLRHLNLTMVNRIQEVDEAHLPFVFTTKEDRHPFNAIFKKFIIRGPGATQGPKSETKDVPLLKLESLRLKRFSIPSLALELVFDRGFLEHLSLPGCRVDSEIWTSLGGHCQLLSLTDVDYELADQRLLDFIGLQKSLEQLTFALPEPTYKWHRGRKEYYITRQVPRLGPGTRWYKKTYPDCPRTKDIPGIVKFKATLAGKVHMKHLHIPPSMYDINKQFIRRLAHLVPNLESLSWGFQYQNLDLRDAFKHVFSGRMRKLKKLDLCSLRMPTKKHEMCALDLQYFAHKTLNLTRNIVYVRYQCNVLSTQSKVPPTYETFYHSQIDRPTWVHMEPIFPPTFFDECITPSVEIVDDFKYGERRTKKRIQRLRRAYSGNEYGHVIDGLDKANNGE